MSDAAAAEPVDAAPPPSLYEKLGRREGIESIVRSFIENITSDPRVSKLFARKLSRSRRARMEAFREHWVELLCHQLGGTEVYRGKELKAIHEALRITDAQVDALLEDLRGALQESGAGPDTVEEVVGIVGAMREEIVPKKKRRKEK